MNKIQLVKQINRSTANSSKTAPRLPLLVALLTLVVSTDLLAPSSASGQQAPPPVGIMYLENSDAIGDPIHNWSTDPALTNPYVQGIALRTQWGRVEPHEHTDANDFYWDFLDQGVALAAAHGKTVSILVTAGVTTPQWVYDDGAPVFMVTEQYGYSAITDGVTTAGSTTVKSAGNTAGWSNAYSVGLQLLGNGIPAGATIVSVNSSSSVTISVPATQTATGVSLTTALISPMPLPWDPVFQAKWGAFIQAFAARYSNASNLAYVVMGGPGRRAEAYFCFAPYDLDYFNNTLGGIPNWDAGVQWIIDQYGTYFPNTPFLLDMASPVPTPDGDAAIQAMCDYGSSRYPGNHFGVKSDGLEYSPLGPPNGSIGVSEVSLLCPTSTVGYQFYLPQGGAVDPVTGRLLLDLGLARGIGFGAHFVEVYSEDCDDPKSAPVLTADGALLSTVPAPPTAETDLTVDPTSSSTTNLSWKDNANNEIGQRIERSVGSDSAFALLLNVATGANSYTDSALIDGTQYYYRVQAYNRGGFSGYSNEQSAITPLNSPTNLTTTTVSSSQISLTWVDNSASEEGYKIEQSAVDDQHFTQIATVGPNVTSYTSSGLSESTKYFYRVRAYNAIATSDYCSEKYATTLSNLPQTPTALTITSLASNKVTLSWKDNSNNEAGFKIQRKQGSTGTYTDIASVGANVTTYNDSGSALLDGTDYYYQVYAYNTAGNSGFSNEVNGITPIATPTSLKPTALSSSQINLTWTNNSETQSGFKIEQSPNDDKHFVQIAVVGSTVTSYTSTGLAESTKYYYRVSAYNALVTSAYSSEKNAKTLSNVPAAPSGLQVTSTTSNKIYLAWIDNSNNEAGFKVQRKKGATGTYTDIATLGANKTTYTDSALVDGTQYYYRVYAYNTAGDSADSNEISGTTLLAAPTGLSATVVSSTKVNLSWTDNSSSETSYLIEREETSSGTFVQIGSVGANVHTYTDSYNFLSKTRYYYRVRATNGTMYSDYSNEPFVTPN